MTNIIIINSTLGAGKSTTATYLAKSLENAIVIYGDEVSEFVDDFSVYNSAKIFECIDLIAAKTNEAESKYKNIVIDYVFEAPEQLQALKKQISPGSSLFCFYLKVDFTIAEERIRKRDLESPSSETLKWELTRTKEILKTQEQYIASGGLGEVIVVDEKSVDQTVKIIKGQF